VTFQLDTMRQLADRNATTDLGMPDFRAVTGRLFDGLYEHTRRQLMTGRPPA
jgi:hypothetical protein